MKNARLSWQWFAISLVLLMSLVATASAQSTWDAIKDRGSIPLGVTEAPPWSAKNVGTGEWEGLVSAIVKQIAKEMASEI